MAVLFASGDALSAKRWSASLFKDAMRDMFFAKFTGPGEDNIIQTDLELTKKKGDRMTFGLMLRMTGEGQESATGITLQGSEEDIDWHDFAVNLLEAGHSTKLKSELDEQRPAFPVRSKLKAALKIWATERLEKKLISAFSTGPTTNREINTGSGEPASGQVFDTAFIDRLRNKAKLAEPKIRPVIIKGKKYWVVLCHTWQLKDLRADPVWRAAQQDIGNRGDENPIFSGMAGIWNGCVIHEYERCVYNATLGEARALLLGAQAGVIAYGHPFKWWEDLLDGNRLPWVGTTVLWGIAKTVFNGEDFAVITGDTLVTPDS